MADEQLRKVRKNFVAGVGEVVIKQLLDGLLEDFVLNDEESETVVKKYRTRSDQARELIDTVKRKGDCASRRMITHLKDLDPRLFNTLGLKLQDPSEPNWFTTLQRTTPIFWKDNKDDPNNYSVTEESYKNRIALLINNIEFKKLEFREGAEKDEENMEELLDAMGYEVVKHTNLTGKAIGRALRDFSEHPKLAYTDSVFIVIMSHGKLGVICGVDDTEDNPDEFPINDIYQHLGTQRCSFLENKPKVILIQACRGVGSGSVQTYSDGNSALRSDSAPYLRPQQCPDGNTAEDDVWKIKHNERDFTSLLSCTPGNKAYRDPDEGCVMIQSTVKVFNSFACNKHIEDLFTLIMGDVATFSDKEKMQIPAKERHTLLKNFYIYPGICNF